ncbi:DsbC family protein (plasmid) [Polymorphobacter sp. PAMC 29334]|nr:DsbC family protein [Polymorphobacter sp. PAMC 29334]
MVPALAAGRADTSLRVALAKRLPKTKITAVDCNKLTGLCEVSAGNTLFYTDKNARYLVIGRVYDMETRTDLTAAKLLELNPDTLLGAAAHNEPAAGDGGVRAAPTKISLAELPAGGAIRWGPAAGPKVVVFTDFHCPYCMKLSETLATIGVRVEERPISVLGTRALSEKVYCSKNPVASLHDAYRHEEPTTDVAKCDTSGLDANEAFARRHMFAGTPIIVRADGSVIEGYRPAAELAAWVKGGAA